MKVTIALAVFLVGFIAIWFIFSDDVSDGGFGVTLEPPELHYAGHEGIGIGHVRVKAFYFVPQGVAPSIGSSWEEIIKVALEATKQFYAFQLHEATSIEFDVYPSVVVGAEDSSYYEDVFVSDERGNKKRKCGNAQALQTAREELLSRALSLEGDLYIESFGRREAGEFRAMVIVYEGEGASALLLGGEVQGQGSTGQACETVALGTKELPALLLSASYLAGAEGEVGLTVLGHEFGHLLGLPDHQVMLEGGKASYTNNDIMGAGRFRLLGNTYLSAESKKLLGLNY